MEQLPPFELLDDILALISHNLKINKDALKTELDKRSSFSGLHPNFFDEAINKIEKDGYLRIEEIAGTDIPTYAITFDGIYFEAAGGYKGHHNRKVAENERLDKLDILQKENVAKLNVLTFVIAAGTAVAALYYIKELLVYLHPCCRCH
jgi:hypothetical protein